MRRPLRQTAAVLLLVFLITPLLAACLSDTTTTPTATLTPVLPSLTPALPSPAPTVFSGPEVVISELLAGIPGNNNVEFIELYNRTAAVIDLNGYTLWYRLPTSQEDLLVYRWVQPALIPPFGHYLLARSGEDTRLPGAPLPDAEFTQPINSFDGGLALRGPQEQLVDALGWGQAPQGFFQGDPAPSLQRGQSLERKPGGAQGNGAASANNAVDFFNNAQPAPQNSGSASTPARAQRLTIRLNAPKTITPGSSFEYTLTVENQSDQPLQNVQVRLPLPKELDVQSITGLEGQQEESTITFTIPSLTAGEQARAQVTVHVPYTYTTLLVNNYTATPSDHPQLTTVGGPVVTRVEGGQVPIAEARQQVGVELTVVGVATMYTGGFFAGSGNTKFYLQDDTGGIQVQVFEDQGNVHVKIGDRVRVRGKVEVYRDSLEIVPIQVPEDVQVIEQANQGNLREPKQLGIAWILENPEQAAGLLLQVQGTIQRVEEFSYSYEIDLAGESGQVLTLYVDKQTNISVDRLETGQMIQAVGIAELRDGKIMLYPRVQQDLQREYPPVVRIEIDAPVNVPARRAFTVTLTAINNSPLPIQQGERQIHLSLPAGVDLIQANGEPEVRAGQITWTLPALPAISGQTVVSATLKASPGAQQVQLSYDLALPPGQLGETNEPQQYTVYIGASVPVGAVQGSGDRSLYVGQTLAVRGVVTAVFPELGGFWLQGAPDNNPQTSDGLFIQTGIQAANNFKPGTRVEALGLVRESNQQTLLQVDQPSDITVVSQVAALPSPVNLNPPAPKDEAKTYFESLEGMYVRVPGQGLVVGPTSQYGEFVLVRQDSGVKRLFQGDEARNGLAIMVDDGSNQSFETRKGLSTVVNTGDLVSNVVGPLAYSYGRYKVEPVLPPKVQERSREIQAIAPAEQDQISLMTWNVENLFDTREPHPSDPPMPTASQYKRQLEKVAGTIAAAGAPDVVGLEEVENIGVLEDIAAQPVLKEYGYQPYLKEGSDSRGIDVGFLVRGERVEVLEVRQYADEQGLFSRPPLLLKLRHKASGEVVYTIENHFLSMSAGVDATEPRRVLQAQANARIVEEIQQQEQNALVAVMGDLNSYYQSEPVRILRNASLVPVLDQLPAEQRYTYIYQGESQVLDYILVSVPLHQRLVRVEVLHADSDFSLPAPDDTSIIAKSDHDPVIAVFSLNH